MAIFDWRNRARAGINNSSHNRQRRHAGRNVIGPRFEHLEDRRLLSVSPAYSSASSYGSHGTPVLTVTNTNDSGTGSLRGELQLAASAYPSGAIIEFNFASTSTSHGYAHSTPVAPVIELTSGPLVISSNVVIDGLTPKNGQSCYGGSSWMPGCGTSGPTTGVTIEQTVPGGSSLFDVMSGVVQINGLTMLGGAAGTGFGGAVVDTDASSVTFQNDIFTSNSASSGGAIFGNNGPVSIMCCSFFNNTATDAAGGGAFGGAVDVASPVTGTQLSVSNSSFTGNKATGMSNTGDATTPADGGYGGAIAVLYVNTTGAVVTGVGTTSITCCSFTSNVAQGGTGAAGAVTSGAVAHTSAIPVPVDPDGADGGDAFGGAAMTTGAITISGTSSFTSNAALGGAGGADSDEFDPGNGGDAAGGAVAAFSAGVTGSVSNGSYSHGSYHVTCHVSWGCSSSGNSYGSSYGTSSCSISGPVTFTLDRAVGGAGGADTIGEDAGDGGAADGGAMAVGSASISGATFASCSATGGAGGAGANAVVGVSGAGNGGDGSDGNGGAIYAFNGLVLSNTTLASNIAYGGAGGNGGTGGTDAAGGGGGDGDGGGVEIGAPDFVASEVPVGTLPTVLTPSSFTGVNFLSNLAHGGLGGLNGDATGDGGSGGDAHGGGLDVENDALVTITGTQTTTTTHSGYGRGAKTITTTTTTGEFIGNEAIGGTASGADADAGVAFGGGLDLENEATVPDVVVNTILFSKNLAQGGAATATGGDGDGGAIEDFDGTLSVMNSQFTGNSAVGGMGTTAGTANGGGVNVESDGVDASTAAIVDAIFSGNFATAGGSSVTTPAGAANGGAISVTEGATLTLTSSQLTSNTATGGAGLAGGITGGTALGGGLYNAGTSTVTGGSITKNAATGGNPSGEGFGGGYYNNAGTITVSISTIVSGNTATTADPDHN